MARHAPPLETQGPRTRTRSESQVLEWMACRPKVSWATNVPSHLRGFTRLPHASMRPSFLPSFMPFLRLTYRQEHRSIRLRCNARPRFHHVGCTVFLGCLVPTRAPCRREADGVSSPQGRAQVVVAHVRRDGLAIARTWALPRRFARGTQVGRRCGRS